MEEICPCGKKIEMQAYKGAGVCSLNCKKKYKGDVSSVGTIMFVTTEERDRIMEARNG